MFYHHVLAHTQTQTHINIHKHTHIQINLKGEQNKLQLPFSLLRSGRAKLNALD